MCRTATEKDITFSFSFSAEEIYNEYKRRRYFYRFLNVEPDNSSCEVSITLSRSSGKDYAHISRYELCISGHRAEFKFDRDGGVESLIVNESDLTACCKGIVSDQSSTILPGLYATQAEAIPVAAVLYYKTSIRRPFYELMINIIRTNSLVSPQTQLKTIGSIVDNFVFSNRQYMVKFFKNVSTGTPKWKQNTLGWKRNSTQFVELSDVFAGQCLLFITDIISGYMSEIMNYSLYIEPIRATAERYYRRQDLAVDEVDSRGQNLAMYLRGLSSHQKNLFKKWCLEHFGFEVATSAPAGGGHVTIMIKNESDDVSTNLADMGFGFSQLIPIVTQLWAISTRERPGRNAKVPVLFAIEQPELHLHPKLQGTLADALLNSIKAAKSAGVDLRLIIETHSEAIINRIGHRIRRGEFQASDVNNVLFHGGPSDSAKITKASFTEKGVLRSWPVGFLEVEPVNA